MPSTGDQSSRFLEAADFIGAKLCRDAIWSGHRCNWFGVPVLMPQRSHMTDAQSICGSDFCSGTSGIAVFLGRLFAATREKIFRTTAEGAIRQALSRLDHFPVEMRKDFNKGLTGVAYSLFEIGESCGIDKFNEMAVLIMEDVGRDQQSKSLCDPATVTALLRMHERYQRDFLLRMAIECGEDEDTRNRSDAGVAAAMLELFKTTGESKYLQAAERILVQNNYEETEVLWTERAYLRAFETVGDDSYAIRAREAIEVIRTRIDCLTEDVDFSFPRGLAAIGDLLLEASRILGDEDLCRAAERVGNWGIDRYKQDDLPWSCGSTTGWDSPGFINGLAGIGYFYLRLHDSAAASTVVFG